MLCAGNTCKRFLSLTTIFNIKHARNSFSSLTTEDKTSVASDKNRAVCARLKAFIHICNHSKMAEGLLQSSEILQQMLELMQKKKYICKRVEKDREDPVIVHVCVSIFKVGNIDTIRQEFQSELYMRLRWEEPNLKGKDMSCTTTITWDSLWKPRYRFINAIHVECHEIKKEILPPESVDESPQFLFHCFIDGTFKTTFELRKFPFDYQDLTLILSSKYNSDELKFVKDDEFRDNICEENFYAHQEWKLYSHVITDTPTSAEMEATSQYSYPRYNIRVSVIRQYKFYIYNVFLIMCLFNVSTFWSFVVKADSQAGRIQIHLTILLTSVAFKYNVQQFVPRVSYLTLIDKYILWSMIFQFIVAFRTAFSTGFPSNSVQLSNFDKTSLWLALLTIVSLHAIFVCLSVNCIQNAKSKIENDERKYIERNPSKRDLKKWQKEEEELNTENCILYYETSV